MKDKKKTLINEMKSSLGIIYDMQGVTSKEVYMYKSRVIDQVSYALSCLYKLEKMYESEEKKGYELIPFETVLIKPGETKELKTNVGEIIDFNGYVFKYDGVLDNNKVNVYFEMDDFNRPIVKVENLYPAPIQNGYCFDILITADSKLGTITFQNGLKREMKENK